MAQSVQAPTSQREPVVWEEFRSLALPLLGEHFPPELIEDNGDSIVFTRSSELSGGGGFQASYDEEHSESVVGMVSEDSGGTSAHFDDAVDGFGGAIAGSGRVEAGQECVLPLAQGFGPGERYRG